MASNSLSVDLANLREKYSEIERAIDLEHLKIKRDTPIHIRQAILENIINLKREQFDLKIRIDQLKAKK